MGAKLTSDNILAPFLAAVGHNILFYLHYLILTSLTADYTNIQGWATSENL